MRISDGSSDGCSSDLHRAALDREIARWAAGALVDRPDRPLAAQRRDEMVERDIMVAAVVGDLAQRHRLDQGQDRQSVVSGKSVSVRVALGGRRIIKKTTTNYRSRAYPKPDTKS